MENRSVCTINGRYPYKLHIQHNIHKHSKTGYIDRFIPTIHHLNPYFSFTVSLSLQFIYPFLSYFVTSMTKRGLQSSINVTRPKDASNHWIDPNQPYGQTPYFSVWQHTVNLEKGVKKTTEHRICKHTYEKEKKSPSNKSGKNRFIFLISEQNVSLSLSVSLFALNVL